MSNRRSVIWSGGINGVWPFELELKVVHSALNSFSQFSDITDAPQKLIHSAKGMKVNYFSHHSRIWTSSSTFPQISPFMSETYSSDTCTRSWTGLTRQSRAFHQCQVNSLLPVALSLPFLQNPVFGLTMANKTLVSIAVFTSSQWNILRWQHLALARTSMPVGLTHQPELPNENRKLTV